MTSTRFATRLNSFASRADLAWPGIAGKPTAAQLIARAGRVPGLTHVDLNYPDQLAKAPKETLAALTDAGLTLNGLAMRYYGDPRLLRGAFTNPDADVRRMAIDLTKRGIDAALEAGANLMTVWLGQDGFDYAFQRIIPSFGTGPSKASRKSRPTTPPVWSRSNTSRTSRALSPSCRTRRRRCSRSRRSARPISA